MEKALKKLLTARQIDYIRIDREAIVLDRSPGTSLYADTEVVIGESVLDAFPELYGLEEAIESIADGLEAAVMIDAVDRPDEGDQVSSDEPINEPIDEPIDEPEHLDLRGLSRGESGERPRLYFDLQIVSDRPGEAMIFLEDVTDRLELERSLVQYTNESNLLMTRLKSAQVYTQQLVTSMADGLLVTDSQGAIETLNPAAIELLGYSEEELIGQPFHALFDDPGHEERLKSAHIHEDRDVELPCYTKAGDRLLLSFSCAVVTAVESGRPRYIYVFRDVTDRYRNQQRLGVQYAIARAITEADTLEQLIQISLQVFCEWLEWDYGQYWRVDHHDQSQCTLAAWAHSHATQASDPDPIAADIRLTRPDPLVQDVMNRAEPVWSQAVVTPKGFSTGFALPIMSRHHRLGVLAFFTHERRSADPDLKAVAVNIGSQIAQFVLRNQAQSALRVNQMQTERLLLNILPPPIVERLRATENALNPTSVTVAEEFAEATVMFADIVGFTDMASQLPPSETIHRLNQIFSTFDRLTERHHLEKIKTIGDAYMVVGGLPQRRPDHLEAIANMALDMMAAVAKLRENSDWHIDIRVGIHTGSVVAGVIGLKKFAYDLWGDTVNVASRMESHGIPGRIQVTAAVYQRLADRYQFEARGEILVKGKGTMSVYFLQGHLEPNQTEAAA